MLVLSGAFDVETAKGLVETYFGDIPSQPLPPELDVTEPREVAATYREWEDPLAPFPAFLIGWKIPKRRSPEFNALYLAGKLLYDGESSQALSKAGEGRGIGDPAFRFYRRAPRPLEHICRGDPETGQGPEQDPRDDHG